MIKKKHSRWRDPDTVKPGKLYIVWINGTKLPHFRILAKDLAYTKDGELTGETHWRDEMEDKLIPRNWIGAVHDLPNPKAIGPNWFGDK